MVYVFKKTSLEDRKMKKTILTTLLTITLIVMFASVSQAIGTWPTPEKTFNWLDILFRFIIPF
jgi:hypothetical protein